MPAVRRSERRPRAEIPPGTGRRPWARGYNSLSIKKAAPAAGTVPGSDESNKRLFVSRKSTMPVIKPFLLLLGLLALLAGCDQQAMFEKFIPKEESAIAKKVLFQLATKDYGAVQKQLDPSVKNTSVQAALEQMAAMFPPEEPKSINTVGANISTTNDVATYDLTFEHEYSNAWLLTNVVLQRRDDQLTVLGLHVYPMKQSLKELNRFTFTDKGILHYIVFGLAITIPLFIVFTLVLCFRTPIAKRKWLWLVFVALGFVQLSINWTDGSYGIQPISFALLGAGFFSAGPYAPIILNIAFPLGAVVFLYKRRSLGATNAG